jgi:hypothetical protein
MVSNYVDDYEDFNNEAAELLEEQEPVQEWVFTFGNDHVWPLTGTSMMKNFIVLNGTYGGTRREIQRRFGGRYCDQYSNRADAGVDRFELAEIRLEFPDGKTVFA